MFEQINTPSDFINLLSMTMIAASYFVVASLIFYIAFRNRLRSGAWLGFLAAFFLMSRGFSQLYNTIPNWRFDKILHLLSIMQLLTAFISVGAAIALIVKMPDILELFSRENIEDLVKERTEQQNEVIQRLQSEIELRQRIEEELNNAREVAEGATRSKSKFLAYMSHEIRTPLGIILSLSEQMEIEENLSDKQRDLLETIGRNGKVVSSVINDILDLSKIEAEKFELEIARINIYSIVKEISDCFSFRASEKGLSFKAQISPDVPGHFFSDQLRVKQILINVLSNAIKNTERGSISLLVSIDSRQKNIVFDVEDTGVGIPAEFKDKIFGLFEQVHSSHVGSGLGLTLSKRFAKLLGGELSLLKTYEDIGTTFRIEIPNLTSHPHQAEILELVPPQDVFEVPDLNGVRILVVDDNEDNLMVMDLLLNKTRANVRLCSSGAEAVKVANLSNFDLVLMDIQMPEMDGYETLSALRTQGYAGPVWAASAYTMKEDLKRSREAGFLHHISKPIHSKGLYAKLYDMFTYSQIS